ncbi:Uncharacterised protein [Vibrio cholerae]|nr:Uncharacterised protein [Vibrio cholerae]
MNNKKQLEAIRYIDSNTLQVSSEILKEHKSFTREWFSKNLNRYSMNIIQDKEYDELYELFQKNGFQDLNDVYAFATFEIRDEIYNKNNRYHSVIDKLIKKQFGETIDIDYSLLPIHNVVEKYQHNLKSTMINKYYNELLESNMEKFEISGEVYYIHDKLNIVADEKFKEIIDDLEKDKIINEYRNNSLNTTLSDLMSKYESIENDDVQLSKTKNQTETFDLNDYLNADGELPISIKSDDIRFDYDQESEYVDHDTSILLLVIDIYDDHNDITSHIQFGAYEYSFGGSEYNYADDDYKLNQQSDYLADDLIRSLTKNDDFDTSTVSDEVKEKLVNDYIKTVDRYVDFTELARNQKVEKDVVYTNIEPQQKVKNKTTFRFR